MLKKPLKHKYHKRKEALQRFQVNGHAGGLSPQIQNCEEKNRDIYFQYAWQVTLLIFCRSFLPIAIFADLCQSLPPTFQISLQMKTIPAVTILVVSIVQSHLLHFRSNLPSWAQFPSSSIVDELNINVRTTYLLNDF